MITNKIEFEYKDEYQIEEFNLEYSACEFKLETEEISIKLDRFHFEELRTKINKLHEAVNQGGKINE